MQLSKKQKLILLLGLLGVYGLAWFLQSEFLLPPDDLWLTQLADIVLHGGNYVSNFFETTPPMAIFIYAPEIYIEKIFSVTRITGLLVYTFFCATILLSISYLLIKKILSDSHGNLFVVILLSLSSIFLVLPLTAFAQREHFFLMLTTPYFLLLVCRLENKKINMTFALLIGTLGAIGFFIKPFFIIMFIALELYAAFISFAEKSGKKYYINPEAMTVFLFLVIYLIAIYAFFNAYLSTVVPIALRFYYESFRATWGDCLMQTPLISCFLSYLIFFVFYKRNPLKRLSAILILVLTGDMIVYFIQSIPWYYHLFPAFAISIFFNIFMLVVCIENNYPRSVLLNFAAALFLFISPLYCMLILYGVGASQKKAYQSLSCFLHKTEFHQPVYILSAYPADFISAVSNANAYNRTRFEFLLWMRSYSKHQFLSKLSGQQKKDADHLTGWVANDLNQQKPKLIFVDTYCGLLNNGTKVCIDYLNFLTKNKNFLLAWRQYHFLMAIKKKGGYQFDVYERNDVPAAVFPIISPSCNVFLVCNKEFHRTALCSHNKITVEPNLK